MFVKISCVHKISYFKRQVLGTLLHMVKTVHVMMGWMCMEYSQETATAML